MGGANRREHVGQWLEPDPEAVNNRLDMNAARRFYYIAQELSVPLVIISRFATRHVTIPRAFCDLLESHCGKVGNFIKQTTKVHFQGLWKNSCAPKASIDRNGLPDRCDREWFVHSICSGRQPSGDDPWESVSSISIYAPLAILVALPGVRSRFFESVPIEVRAASHYVVGMNVDRSCVLDPIAVQKIILRCLAYGARCNVGTYTTAMPSISLPGDLSTECDFDMSEEAISKILPARSACNVQAWLEQASERSACELHNTLVPLSL